MQGRPASYSILLIDDVGSLLRIMATGIRSMGHEVYTATSGEEGMEIFRSNHIDAVVCDLGMEGMDGWEVSEAVSRECNKKGFPKTPFVLLTGWGGEIQDDEKPERFGVDRVIEKPADLFRLLEVIDEIVARSDQQSPCAES